MKIQLNTELKTIKIEESVNLGEFFDKISQIFPEETWREYELQVEIIYNYKPIHIPCTQSSPDHLWRPWEIHYGSNPAVLTGITTVRDAITSLGYCYSVDI